MGKINDIEVLDYENKVNQMINQTRGKGLWNPKGFIILSILFSFLPAAILYSLNYGRLGYSKKRNVFLAISFTAFVVLVAVTYFFNLEYIMNSIFYGINIGAGMFMYYNQSKLFEDHILKGGRKASYLIPVIISSVFVAIIIFSIFYKINIPDQKLMFNDCELYYTEQVQKEEVEKLGNYLSSQGFFGDVPFSVKIDKQFDTYIFSLIIDEGYTEDKELQQYARVISHDLSTNVFNNEKVNIDFCDDVFKPVKTISE